MEIKLMLSKKQMSILAGLAQEPDRQRMSRIFLDLASGREVATSTCQGCDEQFTRQIMDQNFCCSTECGVKYARDLAKEAAAIENLAARSRKKAEVWKPANHLSR